MTVGDFNGLHILFYLETSMAFIYYSTGRLQWPSYIIILGDINGIHILFYWAKKEFKPQVISSNKAKGR